MFFDDVSKIIMPVFRICFGYAYLLCLQISRFFFNLYSVLFLSKNILDKSGKNALNEIKRSLQSLSFFEFYAYGKISIFIILINFLIVFIIIKLFSQFSNLKSSLINLLAIGSSVCGITAIMASTTIIKNNKKF